MPRSAHPNTVPCQLVKTLDGWQFVMCMTPKFWEALAHGIAQPGLLADPRFATPALRREHRQNLSDLLDDAFTQASSQAWMSRLAGKLPVAPVLNVAQALDNPYAASVGMVQTVPHPAAPGLRMVANPVKLDGQRTPAKVCSALGADTDALLLQAGFDAEEIAALRASRTV